LQFELNIIKTATNHFSHQNKIGKGGFGEVYKVRKCNTFLFILSLKSFWYKQNDDLYIFKGVLPDGRQVAVKRLSRCSKQGSIEFKNEVLLIAKLQHKNLVAFIGFCLEEEEKILIYEYMPKGSLDYFLFG